ncbi:polysaccharide deacetylase family protein [Lentzea waywayandensis]|uniref:polysaccharide deacetylase n=1 Tax=Lentzea waywayandensis TaxID=84724 RepID=UPI001FEA6F98|nr:polysaccharide deacetylase [Lentzea waywayandensis]
MTTGVALGLVLAIVMTLGSHKEQTSQADSGPLPMAPRLPAPKDAGPTPTVPAPSAEQLQKQPWMHKLAPGEKPPQFVLFSFDGAVSKQHWDKVLPIAKSKNAHVTGLLSGVYMLADPDKNQYQPPAGLKRGLSDIDFGGTRQDVNSRIAYLNQVIADGHEIGTHYNGHFCSNGTQPSVDKWDTAAWNAELAQFKQIVDRSRAAGLNLPADAVRGGRTPCLEGNWDQAFPAMAANGLVYDTSKVALGVQWPTVQNGLYEFPMPEVKVPGLGKQVVMMDFNLWYSLNQAKDEPSRAADFSQIVLDTYKSVHQAALNGNRAPIVVGNHFNEWNGNAFSTAMEQFMEYVCDKPDTVCATYTEVIQWMQLQDPAVLDQLRRMPAARNW